jgi:heterodisulfide reductase subunit A-like polyferredoxin
MLPSTVDGFVSTPSQLPHTHNDHYRRHGSHAGLRMSVNNVNPQPLEAYDFTIIGAGIGGLSAAAILAKNYNQKVAVFEAHYLVGGCAHAFPIKAKGSKAVYNFDAGT